jgi:hypothetical protein
MSDQHELAGLTSRFPIRSQDYNGRTPQADDRMARDRGTHTAKAKEKDPNGTESKGGSVQSHTQ